MGLPPRADPLPCSASFSPTRAIGSRSRARSSRLSPAALPLPGWHRKIRAGTISWRKIFAVAAFFLPLRIGCLPVVDEKNMLVGVVTTSDFLRIAIALLPDAVS
jgi:CBS domain-containing protein